MTHFAIPKFKACIGEEMGLSLETTGSSRGRKGVQYVLEERKKQRFGSIVHVLRSILILISCICRLYIYARKQVMAALWVFLFCFLAKRISLAIGVIKQAGRAIAAMPLIALWPIVELVGVIAFMAIWMYYAAATASLGDITTKSVTSAGGLDLSYKVYEFDNATEQRGWFLIFCLFWTLNFITAIGQVRCSSEYSYAALIG